MKHLFLTLSVISILLISCGDDDLSPSAQLAEDIQEINDYLDSKGLEADSLDSGLRYIIDDPGSGGAPDINSRVTVKYKGYFTDDQVFDQTSAGNTISFFLQQVIPGWQQGIPLFEKGGKGTLLIPSVLGYGSNPPPGIPENAVLIFDIELVDFD